MDGERYRVLVIYSPYRPELRIHAERLAGFFDEAACEVLTRPLTDTQAPDINAADIVLFGVETERVNPVAGEYGPLLDTLGGMNLAGKLGGLFSISSADAVHAFRDTLLETDITLLHPDLFIGRGQSGNAPVLSEWTARLLSALKDMIDARQRFS